VKRGDRVLTIDDLEPALSPRLDWRSDDAALPDPPTHALIAKETDRIALRLERREGQFLDIDFAAEEYSALEAARNSAQVIEVGGRKIAYIHFWFVHSTTMDKLLERLVRNEFKECEALVFDLRGRGGAAHMVTNVLRVLASRTSRWRKPIVALIDSNTRSAKEMMAYELKTRRLGVLVGQTTAGALLPATFAKVGGDSVLMYPAFHLGKHTEAIEGKGVAPDVEVESPLPFSAGEDPIRDAGIAKALEMALQRARAMQPV
jgi:carboxyl-terminal processing protease